VTGNKSVLTKEHFEVMKDGAIISNSGHFNVEIDIVALEKMSSSKRTTRSSVEEYSLRDGRKINLLGEGRLINLAAAEGHPPSVMDMSFADQALSVDYMVKNYKTLEKTVHKVPDDLDKRVAKLKLESVGIKIDKLTPEQEEYLAGWSEGT
jgi:adenosylhomocysteinase